MSRVLERKIADLILLIPSENQHCARRRIDNLIRVVNESQIPELSTDSPPSEINFDVIS